MLQCKYKSWIRFVQLCNRKWLKNATGNDKSNLAAEFDLLGV